METLPQSGVDALPGFGAAFGTMMIFCLLFYVYFCAMLMLIAKRAGVPNPWMAWVPVLNLVLMCRVARRPDWWIVLALVPLVNLIVIVVLWMDIAKVLGKPAWIGLLFIVPVVGLAVPAYLAFSGAQGAAASAPRRTAEADAPSPPPAARPSKCPSCGEAIGPGDAFCGGCGQAIPQAVAAAPGAASGGPRPVVAIVAVAAVVVMLVIAFAGYRFMSRASSNFVSGPSNEGATYANLNEAVNAGSTDSENQAGQTYGDPHVEESDVDNPPTPYVQEIQVQRSPQGANTWEQPAEETPHQPQRIPQRGQQVPSGGTQTMAIDLGTGAETGDLGEQVYQAVEEATGSSRANTDELIAAALEGPVQRVLDLIGRGADPNARDENGQIPLVMAVLSGDIDIVGTLAAAGADVNGTDGEGRTALHYAIDPMVVDVLLTSGADPNARDHQGFTPLMEAADAGEPDTVEMMLDYGGDPNARDNSGRTALSVARQNGFDDIVQMLARGGG